MSNKNSQSLILIVFFIALGLRLAGIAHGFPFIFHPDEPAVIQTSYGIEFFWNPGHFDWPHLYMYLNFFVYRGFALFREVFSQLGVKDTIYSVLPILWNQDLIFYLITRILSATIGALTVFPVYATAKRLFNVKAGIFAGLAMAVFPFHVWHSHYALIDVPATFFVACTLYFTSGILKGENIQDYIGAGFYSGLAASTKYNGGLSLVTVPLAHLIRVVGTKEKLLRSNSFFYLFIALISSVVAFLIGTPYALLDYKTFSRTDGPKGAFWQFTNVGSVELRNRIPNFFDAMINKVAENSGYTILAVFFVAFLLLVVKLMLRKTAREDTYLWFLVISGLFLLTYISGFEKTRAHYFMIAYPYIVVVFGYFVEKVYSYMETRISYGSIALLAVLFALPFYMSSLNSVKFFNSDTRVKLYTWLDANVMAGDSIVYNSSELSQVIDKLNISSKRSEFIPLDESPKYVVLSFEDKLNQDDFDLTRYKNQLETVYTIDNSVSLGPNITVYRYLQ